ncbi:hypothetical protein GGR57DRAFT_302443 [Xylariaceae sp. FL1272]|nr:hypothetical protein GGR57DRAFT_302443 [Xylariaceae sp. FL1272]
MPRTVLDRLPSSDFCESYDQLDSPPNSYIWHRALGFEPGRSDALPNARQATTSRVAWFQIHITAPMSHDYVSISTVCIGSQLTVYEIPRIPRRHRNRRLAHRPRVTGTNSSADPNHDSPEQSAQRSQSPTLGVSSARARSGHSRPAVERTAPRRMPQTGRSNHVDSMVNTDNDEQARQVRHVQNGIDPHHQHHDAWSHQETSLSIDMPSRLSWDYVLAAQDIDNHHGLNSWTNQPRNEEPFHLIGSSELIEEDAIEALGLDFQGQLQLDADGSPVESNGIDCDGPRADARGS